MRIFINRVWVVMVIRLITFWGIGIKVALKRGAGKGLGGWGKNYRIS
jgi:hypothetical protein